MKVTVHVIEGVTYRFLQIPKYDGNSCASCGAAYKGKGKPNNCYMLWLLNRDTHGSNSCAGNGTWQVDNPTVLAEWTAQRLTGEQG